MLMDLLAEEPDQLLDSALRQTGWAGAPATPATWREIVADKLQSVDWSVARSDVSPFLERRQDADLVDRDVLLGLLRQRRGS